MSERCPFSGAAANACPDIPYIPEGRVEYAHRRWHDLSGASQDDRPCTCGQREPYEANAGTMCRNCWGMIERKAVRRWERGPGGEVRAIHFVPCGARMTTGDIVQFRENADTIPDPFPLRTIEVPGEVTRVAGCDCGGLDYHRAADWSHPGCSIWQLPHDEAMAAVDDARAREQAFTAGLNEKLQAALNTATKRKERA